MKRTIGIIVCILFLGHTYAQSINQNNLPAVVLNSFQLKYPNAENASWKLVEGKYRAKFKINDKYNELDLDNRGNVLWFHQDLWGSEVPESVLKTIKSKVQYFDLDDADLIKEGSHVSYEINFEIDGKDHDFWIDDKGKLLKYRKELKDSEIPLTLINKINTTYGILDIDHSKYIEEGRKIVYIIRGEINDMDHIFSIDDKTTVLKHEQDLRDSEIPYNIIQIINNTYRDYDLRDADMLEEEGAIRYIIKMRKSKQNIYVTFSPDGKILETK